MSKIKAKKTKLDKKFTFTTSQEFLDILSESRWHLKKSQAELIRDAVLEYLDRHLPNDIKSKILKEVK
ncbi:MAG: hypothetical protein GWO07_10440 [Candidatus Dadabacteria bacterium]|nr:hypothetical protein [Candidatus Dadabacteria bacterium]NIS09162.1 hypothetical protein [Candidatus Dadabacteria bacterium]NIY22469.1 hypothetical protein [Candidatus Dadabacteria bacterium]